MFGTWPLIQLLAYWLRTGGIVTSLSLEHKTYSYIKLYEFGSFVQSRDYQNAVMMTLFAWIERNTMIQSLPPGDITWLFNR